VLPHWECHGPCQQGRAECPTPEACERPPSQPDGLELLGGLAVALAAVVVIGLLVGLA
jgi:hypothetical protein